MNRHFPLAFILLFCLICGSCKKDSVEEISLESLSALPSKHPIVVVNFWATWCAPCITEIPHLNRLHDTRPDVHVYAISTDDPALEREVFKFAQRHRIRYAVYVRERSDEGETLPSWIQNVDAIPITYVFKNGTLHNTIFGSVEKYDSLVDAVDGPSEEERYRSEYEEYEENYDYEEDE